MQTSQVLPQVIPKVYILVPKWYILETFEMVPGRTIISFSIKRQHLPPGESYLLRVFYYFIKCICVVIYVKYLHLTNYFNHSTTFTFTFMHLADAFIQRDLQCIQAIHFFLSVCTIVL